MGLFSWEIWHEYRIDDCGYKWWGMSAGPNSRGEMDGFFRVCGEPGN